MKFNQRILSVFILICFAIMSLGTPAYASVETIESMTTDLQNFYAHKKELDEWEVFGTRALGQDLSFKYVPSGNLTSPTDYSRRIIGDISAGICVDDNITTLVNMQETDGAFRHEADASLNNTIWSVIALEFARNNGEDPIYIKDDAIDYIVGSQDADGGFDISGWGADVDSTAHAMIALSFSDDDMTDAIEKAVTYIENKRDDPSGLYDNWGPSVESTAAVIEGYIANNINLIDGTVETLKQYQLTDGSFYPVWDDSISNQMTSYFVLLALADLKYDGGKYHNKLNPITATKEGFKISAKKINVDEVNIDIGVPAELIAGETKLLAISWEGSNHGYFYQNINIDEDSVFRFGLNKTGVDELNIMLWDSLDGMNPVCDKLNIMF